MKFTSHIVSLGAVPMPPFLGVRVYMVPIRKDKPVPRDLQAFAGTIQAMLAEVNTDRDIYLMIDQSPVQAGLPQRRPGLHIDGYWNPAVYTHGYSSPRPGHGPAPRPAGHSSTPFRHGPAPTEQRPTHGATPRQHFGGPTGWANANFAEPEAIILASSISACRGYIGQYTGHIGEGGDCANIDTAGMQTLDMQAGVAYAGNVAMLHESLPVTSDCLRTVVRLNVPGWTPGA